MTNDELNQPEGVYIVFVWSCKINNPVREGWDTVLVYYFVTMACRCPMRLVGWRFYGFSCSFLSSCAEKRGKLKSGWEVDPDKPG